MAALTAHLVAHSRRQAAAGYSVRWLAKVHRIHPHVMRAAVAGRTWRDVPEPPVSC